MSLYDNQPYELPEKILASHSRALTQFTEAGTWLDAENRHAIVMAARQALHCGLCDEICSAVSPFIVIGIHDKGADLPEPIVDLVHRLVRDSSRMTKRWFDQVVPERLSPEVYVEVVGLVATSIVIDSFARGIGAELPEPDASGMRHEAPPMTRNSEVEDIGAWLPVLERKKASEMSGLPEAANVFRCLGLVPLAVSQYFGVMRSHYALTPMESGLNRGQVELIATRMSAYNDCFY